MSNFSVDPQQRLFVTSLLSVKSSLPYYLGPWPLVLRYLGRDRVFANNVHCAVTYRALYSIKPVFANI